MKVIHREQELAIRTAIHDGLTLYGEAHVIAPGPLAADWRRLARIVAHELGRPMRTFVIGDEVVAVLRDWPANVFERTAVRTRLHAAVTRRRPSKMPVIRCPDCGATAEIISPAAFEQAARLRYRCVRGHDTDRDFA